MCSSRKLHNEKTLIPVLAQRLPFCSSDQKAGTLNPWTASEPVVCRTLGTPWSECRTEPWINMQWWPLFMCCSLGIGVRNSCGTSWQKGQKSTSSVSTGHQRTLYTSKHKTFPHLFLHVAPRQPEEKPLIMYFRNPDLLNLWALKKKPKRSQRKRAPPAPPLLLAQITMEHSVALDFHVLISLTHLSPPNVWQSFRFKLLVASKREINSRRDDRSQQQAL